MKTGDRSAPLTSADPDARDVVGMMAPHSTRASAANVARTYLGLIRAGEYLPSDYWVGLEPGTHRVEIEIGCGDGGFLVEAARAQPQTLFVGIETRTTSIRRLQERPEVPSNLRIVQGDARWIVANILASDSIGTYHVYFPDPWWKKRHAKRRLFTPEFCTGVVRTLERGGRVCVMTDVEARYRAIHEALVAAGLRPECWQRDASGGQGAYERKYREQHRSLHQGAFRK